MNLVIAPIYVASRTLDMKLIVHRRIVVTKMSESRRTILRLAIDFQAYRGLRNRPISKLILAGGS